MRGLWVVALFLLLVLPVSASSIDDKFQTGDTISITENTDDNLYVTGGEINIENDVNGDLVVAGGELHINANVKEDLIAVGGDINIQNLIESDVRVAGGNVIVNAMIQGDLLAAGGNLLLTQQSIVTKDAVLVGGEISIEGPIKGNAIIKAGEVYINSQIDGDLSIVASKITTGPNAKIMGNADVRGDRLDPGLVEGQVTFTPHKDMKRSSNPIIPFLMFLIVGLLIVHFASNHVEKRIKYMHHRHFTAFFYGVLTLFAVPIAIILLMVTIIGIPIGLALLAVYTAAIFLSIIFSAILVSRALQHAVHLDLAIYWDVVIGLVVYLFLINIPFMKPLITFLFVTFGLGTFWLKHGTKGKKRKKVQMEKKIAKKAVKKSSKKKPAKNSVKKQQKKPIQIKKKTTFFWLEYIHKWQKVSWV